jgi:hypothetical protein
MHKEIPVKDERDGAKDFIPFLISGAAALAMSAIVVATLFIGTGVGVQGNERTAAASLPHAQHHMFSMR